MKNVKQFIDQMVKVEYLDHCGSFGFYPFQMFVEDKEEKQHFLCLNLADGIHKVYEVFTEYFKKQPKRIYLAVDFPAMLEFENDFICYYIYENGELIVNAQQYNAATGELLQKEYKCALLDRITQDLQHFLNQ